MKRSAPLPLELRLLKLLDGAMTIPEMIEALDLPLSDANAQLFRQTLSELLQHHAVRIEGSRPVRVGGGVHYHMLYRRVEEPAPVTVVRQEEPKRRRNLRTEENPRCRVCGDLTNKAGVYASRTGKHPRYRCRQCQHHFIDYGDSALAAGE